MADRPVLELATLPQRHPVIGDALLREFGAKAVLRLSMEPVLLPKDDRQREIALDRKSPATRGQRIEEVCQIGWRELPNLSADYCARVARTVNAERITEDAAIGVMALLIHELEGVTVTGVLPIGSGGDYLVESQRKGGDMIQVEVSGILRDEATGHRAAARLGQKCKQVLTRAPCGYASVTTFQRPPGAAVHSYLHFVEKETASRPRRRTRRREQN
jgi:hypothetical protein